MKLAFGIWDHFERRRGVPLAQQYDERIRLIQQAEEHGFWGYHVAEHHLTTLDMGPSPLVFLAALARETSTIRIGSMVLCLPMYHPVRLLQELCMVDQLSNGRLIAGVGRGIRDVEHEWFGLDPHEARGRFEETLELLHQGLDTGVLDYQGTFYRFDNVPTQWEPLQRPLPFCYAGNLAYAAKHGMDVFAGVLAEGVLDEFWQSWELGRASGNPRFQREPKVGTARHLYVAETDAEAEKVAERAWEAHGDNFWATEVRQLEYGTVARGTPGIGVGEHFSKPHGNGTLVYGSPETVRADLERFLEHAGPGHNYLVTNIQWGDLSHDEATRSMELYVNEVMPALAATSSAAA